jgi:hypothetical protein
MSDRHALLDHALAAGRSIHVVVGIGVDDLSGIGLTALDTPLAALGWARLEPGAGSLEVAHRGLSMRLDGENIGRAAGRIVFVLESPESRLIDLSRRGPIVGHALESTLLSRIERRTRDEIAPSLVDLVDLATDAGLPDGAGERTLARLLGREPSDFPDPLERAELLARLYRPALPTERASASDALVIEEDGRVTDVSLASLALGETLEGTPERLGLAGGLVMIAAAERLGDGGDAKLATALLRALGGAAELRPSGRVILADRDGGASLHAARPSIDTLLDLPRGG